MIDVIVVFGTRPEAIKMAPVVNALKQSKHLNVEVCVTAQHREMLDQVLSIFEIKPDYDLNIMETGQSLSGLTSKVLVQMSQLLDLKRPKIVLVHGDTTTSFATSLACFYLNIQIGHVEAGLRTNDVLSPFPEEFNRRVTGMVSDFHFAPTRQSKKNLINEGVKSANILVTGNTVIDSLQWVNNKFQTDSSFREKSVAVMDKLLNFDWRKNKFILVTGHRRENFGKPFIEICSAISELAILYPEIQFVYPVHLNPSVQKPVKKILSKKQNIHLINPLEYKHFVLLLSNCFLVLTDSGGIQEEAPSLGKPVLVMRDKTERPEAVEAGTVRLVGSSKNEIINGIKTLVDDEKIYKKMSLAHNPYGDGLASGRIFDFIEGLLIEK